MVSETSSHREVIGAKGFHHVNNDGNVIAGLNADPDGSPEVVLSDNLGEGCASMSVENNRPHLTLEDRDMHIVPPDMYRHVAESPFSSVDVIHLIWS